MRTQTNTHTLSKENSVPVLFAPMVTLVAELEIAEDDRDLGAVL